MTNSSLRTRQVRWRVVLWATSAVLLLLPLAAMQVTDEVRWSAGDFLAAAVLLGAVAAGVELAVRLVPRGAGRAALVGAVALAGALVWAEGAVGLLR